MNYQILLIATKGSIFQNGFFIQNTEFSQEYDSNQVDMVFPLYIQLELILLVLESMVSKLLFIGQSYFSTKHHSSRRIDSKESKVQLKSEVDF